MKNKMTSRVRKHLEKLSKCQKCKTQMNFVDVHFADLPTDVQDLLIQFDLSYQVVNCPKCGCNGLHTYQ